MEIKECGKTLIVSEETRIDSEHSAPLQDINPSDDQDSDVEFDDPQHEGKPKKKKKKSKKNKDRSKTKKSKKHGKRTEASQVFNEEGTDDCPNGLTQADLATVDATSKQKLRDLQKNSNNSRAAGDDEEGEGEDHDCSGVKPDQEAEETNENDDDNLQGTIDKIQALSQGMRLSKQPTTKLSFELPEFLQKSPTDEAAIHEELIDLVKKKSDSHEGSIKLAEEFFRKTNLRMKTSCHSGTYEDFVKKANGNEYTPIPINEDTLHKSIKKTLKTLTKDGPVELEVAFPFEPYSKQLDYMAHMLYGLSTSTHSVFESPAGSGKTLANLITCLAWLKKEQDQGRNRHSKVFYAIKNLRAAPRIIGQLKKTCYQPLIAYIDTRTNFCNNKSLKGLSETELGLKCLGLRTGPGCPCYSNNIADKVVEFKQCFTVPELEEFVQFSKHGSTCGFYTAHYMLEEAQLVFITFEYLTNPTLLQTIQDYLRDSILLMDEATEIEWPATAGDSSSISCRDIGKAIQELEVFKHPSTPEKVKSDAAPPADSDDRTLLAVQAAFVRFKANIVNRFISNKKVVNLESKEFLSMLFDSFLSTKKTEGETVISFDLQKSLAWYLNQINATLLAKAHKECHTGDVKEYANLWKCFNFLKGSLQFYHDFYAKANKPEIAGTPASIPDLDHYAVLIEGVGSSSEEDIKLSIHCLTASFSLLRLLSDGAPRCMFFVSSTIFPKNYFYTMYGIPFALTYQCQSHVLPLPQSQFIIRVSPLKVRFDDWKDASKPGLELLGKSIIDLVKTLETTMDELHQNGGQKPIKPPKEGSAPTKTQGGKNPETSGELRNIVIEKLNSGLLEKKQPIKQQQGRGYVLCFCSAHAKDQAFEYWKQSGALQALEEVIPVYKDGANKKEASKKDLKADSEHNLPKSNKRLDKFKRVILSGKSAILLTDYNDEKLTERIDFVPAMSRIIMFIGFPGTLLLKDRFGTHVKKYLDKMNELDKPIQVKDINEDWMHCERLLGKDWGHNNSVRAINQSVGQAIREKHDYGAVILIDDRYINTRRKIDGLCTWMTNSLQSPETPEKLVADVVSFFEKIGCNGENLMKAITDEEERLRNHAPKDSVHQVHVLMNKMAAYDHMAYSGMRYYGAPPNTPGLMQPGSGMKYYGEYPGNQMNVGYYGAPKIPGAPQGAYPYPYYNNYGYAHQMPGANPYYKTFDGKPIPNAYAMPSHAAHPHYPQGYYGWGGGMYGNPQRNPYQGYSSSNRGPVYGGRDYLHPNSYSNARNHEYRSNRLGWGYQGGDHYVRKHHQQKKPIDPNRSVGVELLGVLADIPAEFANLGAPGNTNPLKSPSTPSSPSSGSPARMRRLDHRPSSYAIEAHYEKYRKLYQEREAAKNEAAPDGTSAQGAVGLQQSEIRGIMEKYRVNEVVEKVKKRDFLTNEKTAKELPKEGGTGLGAIERTGDTNQSLVFRPRKCPIPDEDDDEDLEDSEEESIPIKKTREEHKKVQSQSQAPEKQAKKPQPAVPLRCKELDEFDRLKAQLEENVKGKTPDAKRQSGGGLRLLSKQQDGSSGSGDEEESKGRLLKSGTRPKLLLGGDPNGEGVSRIGRLLGEPDRGVPEVRLTSLH